MTPPDVPNMIFCSCGRLVKAFPANAVFQDCRFEHGRICGECSVPAALSDGRKEDDLVMREILDSIFDWLKEDGKQC